jgi:hypothetical protein
MANTQAMCSTFKRDLLNGLHAFGTSVVRAATTADSFKGALYFASATINASTTAYSATNEVTNTSGSGYTATGLAITAWNAPSITGGAGTTAYTTPTASLVWSALTVTTAFDALLIYNDTASGKNAVSVHNFGSQTITAGTLTLTMPTNDGTTGLIRIA